MKFCLQLLILTYSWGTCAEIITCQTPRKTRVLTIRSHSVVVARPFALNISRSPVSEQRARTRKRGNLLEKILYVNGNKHLVHIENVNSFSFLDDYLTIRNLQGHEITYPLECKKVKI